MQWLTNGTKKMTIELIDGNTKIPRYYVVCNGVAKYSRYGYFCDGGNLSVNEEKKRCWENRNKILLIVERARQNSKEKISVNDICVETKLTEEFVTFVLENEFGELEEEK